MTTNLPPIITAENLTVGYEDNIVWQDANFTIDHGEFVAIIGPNGSGKTTLFRLLLGSQQPVQSTIRYLRPPNAATSISDTYRSAM